MHDAGSASAPSSAPAADAALDSRASSAAGSASAAGVRSIDAHDGRPCGLLVDWGGVLTTNVFESFDAFCAREGLATGVVRHAFVHDDVARDALVGLEIGTLPEPEFEARVAGVLGVDATNLIERLMGGAGPDLAMMSAVRSARDHGIATGLISNSWGASRYDADLLRDLFDGVVISARVGLRKPAPEIYALGAEALHLGARECVFVDDLRGNLKPARALGMTTVHHTAAPSTIARLTEIFGVDLR